MHDESHVVETFRSILISNPPEIRSQSGIAPDLLRVLWLIIVRSEVQVFPCPPFPLWELEYSESQDESDHMTTSCGRSFL